MRGVSYNSTKATARAMFVAAETELFKVNASELLTKKGIIDIAAPFCMRFVSHESLKVARKPMIEIGT